MRSRWSSWLARFSFSFVVIAMLLFWESYRAVKGQLGPLAPGRIVLFLCGGLVSFVMGMIGVRERHRMVNEDNPPPREEPPRE